VKVNSGQLFCFGLGYSSQEIAKVLAQSQDWRIVGTTRSSEKLEQIKNIPGQGVIWPGDNIKQELARATHWLISIPPVNGIDIVAEFLTQCLPECRHWPVKWIGYFSTTAVYGDHQGRWVNEETVVKPAGERGKSRVNAEKKWISLSLELDVRLCIFRLAGIYGPNRGPVHQMKNRLKRKIIKEGQFFNRIHVQDIAGAVIKSIESDSAKGIFNICDDFPERPDFIVDYTAKLLNINPPKGIKFEDAELSPMARSFYGESKRVSNSKLKKQLGYKLKYPDYMQGFAELIRE